MGRVSVVAYISLGPPYFLLIQILILTERFCLSNSAPEVHRYDSARSAVVLPLRKREEILNNKFDLHFKAV
jgi:hypothetical protein